MKEKEVPSETEGGAPLEEECTHYWTNERVSYDEVEQMCVRCKATRKGYVAWRDWEK